MLQKTRIFSTFVTPTAAQRALAEAQATAAATAATEAGEVVSVISEEDKEVHERCINKVVEQNKHYDPTQVFRWADSEYGLAQTTNSFLAVRGGSGSPRGTVARLYLEVEW